MPTPPRIADMPGWRLAAVSAGLKQSGAPDLGLIVAERPAAAAGVFTRNRVQAAPVRLSRTHLRRTGGAARAVVVNAGIANACTGPQGRRDALATARTAAELVGCAPEQVLVCSTGLIGARLPMDRVRAGLAQAHARLGRPAAARAFARAILTTDTRPKQAGVRVRLNGRAVCVAGAAKGAGMIAPDMATLLAFVLTDAAVAPGTLRALLAEAVDPTLNCLTVDGDTSTNDTCLALASGRAGNRPVRSPRGPDARALAGALREVLAGLTGQLARDAEGAGRLARVRVRGARSPGAAQRAARTVAQSPLVKTALAGADPNWGRIVAALGRSGAGVREARLRVSIAGTLLFDRGAPAAFDAARVARAMRKREVDLDIDLGQGQAAARIYTCDLTHGYITINAEYHT